jgi:hypothetical protein
LCIEIEDWSWALANIQNVNVYGKRYNNALILWAFGRGDFVELEFYGKDQELGIKLPTGDDTNNHAVDAIAILGFKSGLLAIGDVSSGSGELRDFAELVSISR